ncbi:MAG: hypothetical protein PVI30_23610 [Myxococcales bacterium]
MTASDTRGRRSTGRASGCASAALLIAVLCSAGGARADGIRAAASEIIDSMKAGLGDDGEAAVGEGADDGQEIYLYRDRDGRQVYTNIVEQVPLEQREEARVDLSHISLNTELGNEISRQLQVKHAALVDSDYCRELREAAEAGFWATLWHEFAPLVICGGVLLLFLLFTPSAMKRFGAPVWAKTLTMAIPFLALSGLAMFGMTHTNRAVTEFKRQAEPCTEQGLQRAVGDSENPVKAQARLVHRLRDQATRHALQKGLPPPGSVEPKDPGPSLTGELGRGRDGAARGL